MTEVSFSVLLTSVVIAEVKGHRPKEKLWGNKKMFLLQMEIMVKIKNDKEVMIPRTFREKAILTWKEYLYA